MPRPQTTEAELRAAFDRLKNDCPERLPRGASLTLTNVAAEAGKPPSSLRADRYTKLHKEISAFIATSYSTGDSNRAKKTKKKPRRSPAKLIKRHKRDNSKLLSLIAALSAHIEELERENALLREGKIAQFTR